MRLTFLKSASLTSTEFPSFFLPLLGLRRQDVAEKSFMPLYLSRPGFLEALGSALVCF